MEKRLAIKLLGDGKVSAAAKRLGVSYQAVNRWPETLPPRIRARVIAELARPYLPPDILAAIGTMVEPHRGDTAGNAV